MKIREQVEVEPAQQAYEYKRTFYGCDVEGCGFETEQEDEYKKHFGKTHAAKESRVVNEISFYRFETEQDMKLFAEAQQSGDGGWFPARWYGPGWFGVKSGQEPCGRGCCTRWYNRMYDASDFEQEWQETRDQLNAALDQMQSMVKHE
jgi:hypothetical protein